MITIRPQKITFADMRAQGVRGLLIYCADYKCSHSIAISGDPLIRSSSITGDQDSPFASGENSPCCCIRATPRLLDSAMLSLAGGPPDV
jgi:hypothetical protein